MSVRQRLSPEERAYLQGHAWRVLHEASGLLRARKLTGRGEQAARTAEELLERCRAFDDFHAARLGVDPGELFPGDAA
jgi:hypothetical protein